MLGVPQGSIPGPFLSMFTPAICFSKLIAISGFCCYADHNIVFTSRQNYEKLVNSVQSTLNGVFEWYQEKNFKANADKCHLFMSLFFNNKMTIANYKITSRNSKELLGEVTDSEATFAKPLLEG